MRLLVLVLILIVPSVASAQADSPSCVLGIYDDPQLWRNFGSWNPQTDVTKILWVGIRFEAGFASDAKASTVLDGFVGVEFSIDGIRELNLPPWGAFPALFVLSQPHFPLPPLDVDIRTPDDELNGSGGITISWNTRGSREPHTVKCLQGTQLLMRVDIVSLTSIPTDVALSVRQKFPQTDPLVKSPLLWKCDAPRFTRTAVTGGCYVINPTVGPRQSAIAR